MQWLFSVMTQIHSQTDRSNVLPYPSSLAVLALRLTWQTSGITSGWHASRRQLRSCWVARQKSWDSSEKQWDSDTHTYTQTHKRRNCHIQFFLTILPRRSNYNGLLPFRVSTKLFVYPWIFVCLSACVWGCVYVCIPKDEAEFDEVFQKANFSTHIFKNRVKLETYNVSNNKQKTRSIWCKGIHFFPKT